MKYWTGIYSVTTGQWHGIIIYVTAVKILIKILKVLQ